MRLVDSILLTLFVALIAAGDGFSSNAFLTSGLDTIPNADPLRPALDRPSFPRDDADSGAGQRSRGGRIPGTPDGSGDGPDGADGEEDGGTEPDGGSGTERIPLALQRTEIPTSPLTPDRTTTSTTPRVSPRARDHVTATARVERVVWLSRCEATSLAVVAPALLRLGPP